MERMIEVRNLIREYGSSDSPVLKGIDFLVEKEDFVTIMGRSGCGKSTFLRVLGLIDSPDSGEVFFKDENSKELWVSQLADIRRRDIGFVYQDARLMDCLTIEQNIKLPLIFDKKDSETTQEKMMEQTKRFGIDNLVHKYPKELSGGEKLRAALCRALVSNPDLILADEPTGNLDTQSGETVIHALEEINRILKKTVIVVTHDPKIASRSKKTVLLKDGLILDTIIRPEGDEYQTQREFFDLIMEKIPEL